MTQLPWFSWSRSHAVSAFVLATVTFATCASITTALHNSVPGHANFWQAVIASFALLGFIPLFLQARFSFGYLVGISFYGMIIGFFWITYFTGQLYDHTLARWSAAASLLLFLLPVLFQTAASPRPLMLSQRGLDRLILGLLGFSFAILAIGASYGFALVGLARSEELRGAVSRPAILNYAIGSVTGAMLPFIFALSAWRRRYGLAAIAIFLEWAYYPIVLNKSVVFGGLWLPYLFVIFRLFEPKRAAVYSLLIPMVPGIIGYNLIAFDWLAEDGAVGRAVKFVIGLYNIRVLAFPSMAMNYYSEFFSSHPLTHFCQIGIIRAINGCPYPFQLGATLAASYNLGNFNGSLFATEGIASVGPFWAPVSALLCGLIVSLGSTASAHLPAPVVATSAGLAIQQALLNVPLSVSMLSNGVVVLWLLWSITPDLTHPTTCDSSTSKHNRL